MLCLRMEHPRNRRSICGQNFRDINFGEPEDDRKGPWAAVGDRTPWDS